MFINAIKYYIIFEELQQLSNTIVASTVEYPLRKTNKSENVEIGDPCLYVNVDASNSNFAIFSDQIIEF